MKLRFVATLALAWASAHSAKITPQQFVTAKIAEIYPSLDVLYKDLHASRALAHGRKSFRPDCRGASERRL